jgi:hypothetical protein
MEFSKNEIIAYYDELSRVLTDWENGEISDYELYSFMVDTHNAISEKLN